MGAKHSSFASIFTLKRDQPAVLRGPIKGAYIDYRQFPVSGVIGVSSTSIFIMKNA